MSPPRLQHHRRRLPRHGPVLSGHHRRAGQRRARSISPPRSRCSPASGIGYLSPVAQLNSTTRSSSSTIPSRAPGDKRQASPRPRGTATVRPSWRNRRPRPGSPDRRPPAPRRPMRAPRAGSGNRRPPWARECPPRPSPRRPSARHAPRPLRTRARSARSPTPGRRTCAAASTRSSRAAPSRRTPSTSRSARSRRRSDRRSRRAIPSRTARPARAPSSSCPRSDTAP